MSNASSTRTEGGNVPAAETSPPRRPVLLIVDDDVGVRESLRVVFKDDYEVLLAPDGPAAIELAQRHPVAVAVLDIRMSGMSGIEVLERLRYVDPHIEVVMMTAFETADTLRQALRLHAADYISKPFDIATMREAVRKALQRRSLSGDAQPAPEHVEQLLTELQEQRLEEQIARTRGDIYASIIHDINNPLTVIFGYIQILNTRLENASELRADDLRAVKDMLQIVTRRVTHCIEITRRYLGFLRQQAADPAQVSVNQLLADLAELVRTHPAAQPHEFRLTPLTRDLPVRMNGTDLIQTLLNLATNAFQCTADHHRVEIFGEVMNSPLQPGEIRDGPEDRWIGVETFENEPPLVRLSVRDNGPGIPPEVFPRIFDPYFTTKGARQGTGLGLNIVQRFVKAAKGALHVHSRPGQGTTFTIYVPGVDESSPA